LLALGTVRLHQLQMLKRRLMFWLAAIGQIFVVKVAIHAMLKPTNA